MKRFTVIFISALVVLIFGTFTSCEQPNSLGEKERLQKETLEIADSLEIYFINHYKVGDSVVFVRENGELEKFKVKDCYRDDAWFDIEPEKDPVNTPWSKRLDAIFLYLILENMNEVIFFEFSYKWYTYDEIFGHPRGLFGMTFNDKVFYVGDIPYDIIHQQELSYSMENDSSVGFVMRKDVGIVRMWDNRGRTWTRPEDITN